MFRPQRNAAKCDYGRGMKKFFFGFRKCYSVTAMLFEPGWPSFATAILTTVIGIFYRQWTVQCAPYSFVARMRCFYVAAKATYIRLLNGKIGFLGGFSALAP